MNESKQAKDDYDSPWKDVLEVLFKEMMDFLFPEVSSEIDWSKGYKSEKSEFQKITSDAKTGRRYADNLVRVYKKADGKEALIFIHVEVQAQKEDEFAERMFIYNYRIYDRFRKPVISLAILTDENKRWRPEGYGYGLKNIKMWLNFSVVKLIDFVGRWEELESSDNIFSLCIMAQLKAMETKKGYEQRKIWKMNLLRLMLQKGHNREEIFHLLRFIDWVLKLPEEVNKELWEEFNNLEEVKKMPYISGYEKLLIEKGVQQGVQQGLQQGLQQGMLKDAQEMVLEAIDARFGMVPGVLEEKVSSLSDRARLKRLLRTIMKAADIKEVEKEILN